MPRELKSITERFWTRVNKKDPNDCWQWTGFCKKDGYGQFWFNYTIYKAHRVSYALSGGKLLRKLILDHLCRNRACVNPAHLEQVSIKENVLRGNGYSGKNFRKTHCVRGHELNSINMRIENKGRRCKICRKITNENYIKRNGAQNETKNISNR